jgi:hypothetical protein
MYGVILHPIPEEHQLRGRFNHEAQLLLYLVHADIASQQ